MMAFKTKSDWEDLDEQEEEQTSQGVIKAFLGALKGFSKVKSKISPVVVTEIAIKNIIDSMFNPDHREIYHKIHEEVGAPSYHSWFNRTSLQKEGDKYILLCD